MLNNDLCKMVYEAGEHEMLDWPRVMSIDLEKLSNDSRFDTYTYTNFASQLRIVSILKSDNGMLNKDALKYFMDDEYSQGAKIVWAKEKPDELREKTVNIEHLQKEKPDLPKYQSLINILNAMFLIESARSHYNGNIERYFADVEEAFDDTTDDAKEFMTMIYDMYYDFMHFDKNDPINTYQELYNRLKGSAWLIS